MATLAKRIGASSPKTARTLLLRAQVRCGKPLMFRTGPLRDMPNAKTRWYTTEALLTRYAPELVDCEPEAVEAVKELKELIIKRLETITERIDELEGETRRAFRAAKREIARLDQQRQGQR